MLLLRDLPKLEVLNELAARYGRGRLHAPALAAYILLLRVASDGMAACEAGLAGHGLTQSRFTVLMLLRRTPSLPQSPSSLATRAGVTRPAMTGLLDGLERDGLIARVARTDDRRRIDVGLTDQGFAMLDRVLPGHFERLGDILGELAPEECQALMDLLGKVRTQPPAWTPSRAPASEDPASDARVLEPGAVP